MMLEDAKKLYTAAIAVLALPDLPSPRWFAGLFSVGDYETAVREDGSVSHFNDVLRLLDGHLTPGAELLLHLKGNRLIAEDKAVKAALEAERIQKTAKAASDRQLAYAHLLRQNQQAADQHNGKLNIPVRWTSGQKKVLSGLTASSAGTGENIRTVNHVLLLGDISEGRFVRKSGSFLCTSPGGSDGQFLTGRLYSYDHGDDGLYVSRITCKQCLRIAGRWTDATKRFNAEIIED
jgi:hypothetical protein